MKSLVFLVAIGATVMMTTDVEAGIFGRQCGVTQCSASTGLVARIKNRRACRQVYQPAQVCQPAPACEPVYSAPVYSCSVNNATVVQSVQVIYPETVIEVVPTPASTLNEVEPPSPIVLEKAPVETF